VSYICERTLRSSDGATARDGGWGIGVIHMVRVSIRKGVGGPCGVLANRMPFSSHGAMSAVEYAPSFTGRLPVDWAERYRADNDADGITFTVCSWATPIAWVRATGEVVIPDVSYSSSTKRHQNLCRAWLT
jgi:hypothetical protein